MAKHLVRYWGYAIERQNGSHIMLRTDIPSGHTATVPAHKPMKIGTLEGILRDVANHKRVHRSEILRNL